MSSASNEHSVTRRTVARAAAWSAPVVAMAAAAPAATASPEVVVLIIKGPTNVVSGSTASYSLSAVNGSGSAILLPEGCRLTVPAEFTPSSVWSGGWSWQTYELTTGSDVTSGIYGTWGGSGAKHFWAYLPGSNTVVASKTVTVTLPPP